MATVGLQQRTYAIGAAPDWTQVAAALAASMGVGVRAVPGEGSATTIRARAVGGSAHAWFGDGRIEWEASLTANPYFLAHLHHALVAAGARPTDERPEPPKPSRWSELSFGVRVAHGVVGQVARGLFMLAISPLLLVGLVLANVYVVVRNGLRRR